MKQKVINFLLIITILASCSGNRMYDSLMQRADSIMDLDDDSAKVAIQMLDGVKPQLSDFTKGQKMRYELLYHKAMNKAYIPFTSDSIMLKVTDYYENHGSANDRMLAYYVLGCVYRDMHEAPMALEYYHKAIEQADTTARDCDYRTLCRIYSQMGQLFANQYLPYQELSAYTRAVKYAYLAKDTFNAIANYQNIAGVYTYLNKKDSVKTINLKVAKMYEEHGDNMNSAIAFGCNLAYYIENGDAVNAKKAFESYSSTGYEGNPNYEDSKAFIHYEKGSYYMFVSQLDSAYHYFSQSLAICKSNSNKALIMKALALYYMKTNQSSLAVEFAIKSSDYNDSDLLVARKTQLQQIQAMYDYNRHQKKAILAEQKAIQRTYIIYIIAISSLLILILVVYVFRKKMNLKKKRIETTQLLYNDSLVRLLKLQEELSQLKQEKDNIVSLKIQEKEEAICRLKREISDIRERYFNPLLSDTDVILKNSSIYKKLRYIEMHPKEQLCQEDWLDLEKTVEHLIPSIIPILKDRLGEKEYHICLLVRLGFSTSFIANLVKLTPSGVSAARKKMLKKLCNRLGTPKDFDEFVCQIQ